MPHTDAELKALFARAAKIDFGFMLLLKLQLLLGLRSREALLCSADLQNWYELLMKGKKYVLATRGCKGGRPRHISVLTTWQEETILTLAQAAEYCRAHGGRLIRGRKNTLRGSLNRLKRLYQRAGLVGEKSSQSLRYGYGCQNAIDRNARGEPALHALGEIAEDLGHGAKTRKRFTLDTYLQSVSHLFEDVEKNGRLLSSGSKHVAPKSRVDTDVMPFVPRSRMLLDRQSKTRRHRPSSVRKTAKTRN